MLLLGSHGKVMIFQEPCLGLMMTLDVQELAHIWLENKQSLKENNMFPQRSHLIALDDQHPKMFSGATRIEMQRIG